jgi:hypothetical protein
MLCCVIALAGCGGYAKAPDTRSKVEYFRAKQGVTVTPHGKIKMDTVTEVDGKIQYQTEDGRRWRVEMAKQADGTYQYGAPTEVK